ncbi:MAG: FxsA family protein [Pseudomonadota bacterium]
MWLLILFIAIPLLEIGLFIQIGGFLGLWPTLGVVVITALAGTALVRAQGAGAMDRLRRSMETLDDPSEPLADGAMILLSGALLVTPGFFTDAVGFALLVPQVRHWVFRRFAARLVAHVAPRPGGPGRDGVIEGEFEDVTRRETGPSGWTRH